MCPQWCLLRVAFLLVEENQWKVGKGKNGDDFKDSRLGPYYLCCSSTGASAKEEIILLYKIYKQRNWSATTGNCYRRWIHKAGGRMVIECIKGKEFSREGALNQCFSTCRTSIPSKLNNTPILSCDSCPFLFLTNPSSDPKRWDCNPLLKSKWQCPRKTDWSKTSCIKQMTLLWSLLLAKLKSVHRN